MRICAFVVLCLFSASASATDWLLAKAYKLPSQYTNQESGYFSIIEGHNGKLYIGCAKYGVDAYLLEFDPKTEKTRMVMDVHQGDRLEGDGLRRTGQDSHAEQRRHDHRQDLRRLQAGLSGERRITRPLQGRLCPDARSEDRQERTLWHRLAEAWHHQRHAR